MQHIQTLIPNLIVSVPVWAILLYFLTRSIRVRDTFEKDIRISLSSMQTKLHAQDTSIALLRKDIEHMNGAAKAVHSLSSQFEKLRQDIDAYYTRLREVEGQDG